MTHRVAVLLYPGCIFLEIAPALEVLAPHCKVSFYTPDGAVHQASNGSRLLADGSYADCAAAAVDAALVPGGDPDSIIDPGSANACLQAAHRSGALLAGICAGALVLARAGLLRGRKATHNYTAEHTTPEVLACTDPLFAGIEFQRADIMIDRPFITAQHWAKAPFAAALATELGLWTEAQARHYLGQQRFSYDNVQQEEPRHGH